MRIAQVSPLFEAVPPKLYGGTERVVHSLTEELVALGHDVTLFASGDSITSATLAPMRREALRLDPTVRDWVATYMRMVELIYRRADEFDVIHFHIDLVHYPLFRSMADSIVTTLHGRLDLPDLLPFYRAFPELPLVSVSKAQRKPMPPVNWMATVHHGLPRTLYRPHAEGGGYLAFLGRVSREKGVEAAIAIAERAGMPLKIAAKVDLVDRDYFETCIKPLLTSRYVEFIGEIGDEEKNDFLGNALALVFPICWPEPFGLVMIEAAACGTPVIAFNCGSVAEVIEDGVTGFIVQDVAGAARAIGKVPALDRLHIRRRFEQRFTVEQMTAKYLDVYSRLLEGRLGATVAA